MTKNLLHADEHIACKFYVSDRECGFRYLESLEAAALTEHPLLNRIVFILDGEIVGSFNEFQHKTFKAGECFFLPRRSVVSVDSWSNCKLMYCAFDVPRNVCDKLVLIQPSQTLPLMPYNMQPVVIRPQMRSFLDGLLDYLSDGINCMHLHELKQSEMFLIFRWFYPKEELSLLFYPMIGKTSDFRSAVLENYTNVKSVNELAVKLNMSRSAFDLQFKQEFEDSPARWISKQKANKIRYYMSDPKVTIADVMTKFDFEFPSQFTRFCKAHFGCTPTKLFESIRMSEGIDAGEL